jgi:hypothetical protein
MSSPFHALVPAKPTTYGHATLTGAAVPASLCWEIPERIAKIRGRGRYRGRLLKLIDLGFRNEKTDPDTDSEPDTDVHCGRLRFALASQSHGF